jgi:hypothetical protein
VRGCAEISKIVDWLPTHKVLSVGAIDSGKSSEHVHNPAVKQEKLGLDVLVHGEA